MLQSILTNLAAFLGGVVTGLLPLLVGYFQEQRKERTRYTTDLLNELNASDYLAPLSYRAWKICQSNVGFDTLSDPDLEAVEKTLDYWEFVAVCHRQGLVDLETVVRLESGNITCLFDAAHDWIEAYRARVGSNSIYHELEQLVGAIREERRRIYGDLARSQSEPKPGTVKGAGTH